MLSQLVVIDVTCVIMSVHRNREPAAGGECLEVPQEKKLEGNADGNDIKNRPNDLLVPWLVSKHSVLQFGYQQVLFSQCDRT